MTCYLQLYIDWIFGQKFQSPRPSFADWMGVVFQYREHFNSKIIFFKMLKTWLVFFLRLTLQCWPVIAQGTVFLDTGSFFLLEHFLLRTLLPLDIFFFLNMFKKESSPPLHWKNQKISNFCFIWKWSLIWDFFCPQVF